MTPLLILLFGISPEKAVATDLIYASITKTGGSIIHAIHRTIDWSIVTRLATGSLPAATATLLAFYYLGVARQMYLTEAEDRPAITAPMLSQGILVVAAAGVVAFGVYPIPLIDAAQRAVNVFV